MTLEEVWSIIDIDGKTILIMEDYGKMIIDVVNLDDTFQVINPQVPTSAATSNVAIPNPFVKTGFVGT